MTAQGASGGHIGAGGAAQTQIDAVGEQGGEGAELFGNHQRRMVRQHDPARTDADGAGPGGDMADHDGSGGRGDARHVVMLGQPEAVIALGFGQLSEVERVFQGVCRAGAFGDGGEIEERIFHDW